MYEVLDAPVRTATADFPELCVEWLPTVGPYAGSGEWSDITDYVTSVGTSRGTQYELDQMQTGSCSFELRSASRLFDPENAAGPFYPYLLPLRQVRVSSVWPVTVPDGVSLDGTGDYVSTPDAAAWTVSGVLEAVVRVKLDDYTSATQQTLVGQWNTTGNQRGWTFGVAATGALVFTVSANGSTPVAVNVNTAGGLADGTAYWLGFSYNTATGVWAFYRHADQLAEPSRWDGWTQLATNTATATVPFDSSASLIVGAHDAGAGGRAAGTIYAVSLYDDGVQVSSPNFTSTGDPTAIPGAATYTDAQSNVWTLQGDAEITEGTENTLFHVWRGYITDWGETVSDDSLFVTTVEAKDATVLLEQTELRGSWYETAVAKKSPTHWWRLDEPDGSTVPLDTVTEDTVIGLYDGGLPTLGETAIVPFDGGRVCTTWGGAWITIPNYAPQAGSGFTIEGWFQLPLADNPALNAGVPLFWFGLGQQGDSTFRRVDIQMLGTSHANAGQVAATYITESGFNTVLGSDRIDDGEPHHFAVQIAATSATNPGEIELFVDGVSEGSDFSGHDDEWDYISGDPIARRGAVGTGYYTTGRQVFAGTQSHLVVYERLLTAAEILDNYTAGATGITGSKTGTVVGEILDSIDWPPTLRNIDTGISTVGAYDQPDGDALGALRDLQNTELGRLFIDRAGKIVFQSRHAPILETTQNAVWNTFGDTHSGEPLKCSDRGFELPRDETLIRNPVRASRQNGLSFTAEDKALQDTYGPRGFESPATLDQLDSAIPGRAAWLLAHFKDRRTRLASMVLLPRTSTALLEAVLGVELGYRIEVKRTPLGLNAETVTEQFVEKIEDTITPMWWEQKITGSPADSSDGFLIIGTGKVDVDKVAY